MGCQNDPTAAGAPGVKERWYQAQPGSAWARPAISGDLVYFGTGQGDIIARDVTTGSVRWQTKIGSDAVNGANILVRNGVVVAPVLNSTVALDANSGQILWRYSAPPDTVGSTARGAAAPGQVIASEIDADDFAVYIPAWGASISAVDPHTGSVRWVWQPSRTTTDTATSGVFRSGAMGVHVAGDTVFATVWHYLNRQGGSSEAWLLALDRLSGRELWRTVLPYVGSGTLIWSAPVVFQNLVIVHTLSARTYAIDRTTHQVAWEFTSPAAMLSTVAGAEMSGDTVYVDGGDGNIYALRASDGRQLWSSSFASQASRNLLVTPRRVIFTDGRTLYVLDRLTGHRVTSVTQPRTSDPLFSSPAAYKNGLVFVTVAEAAWCFNEP